MRDFPADFSPIRDFSQINWQYAETLFAIISNVNESRKKEIDYNTCNYYQGSNDERERGKEAIWKAG